MGFWKLEDGRIVGDGPLDATDDFLRAIAKEYEMEIGRKPSLAEIMACLENWLHFYADEYVSDGDKMVTDIKVVTKKRPRRQKPKPGDIVAVPLDDKSYGFLWVCPQDMVFDVFMVRRAAPRTPVSALRNATRKRFPHYIAGDPVEKGLWRIVGRLPYPTSEFTKLEVGSFSDEIATPYAIEEMLRDVPLT